VAAEAVVKESEAAAQHGLGRSLSAAETIGERDTRSEVMMVLEVVLCLIPQPVAQGEVVERLPVRLRVQANVGEGVFQGRLVRDAQRKLARRAGLIAVVGAGGVARSAEGGQSGIGKRTIGAPHQARCVAGGAQTDAEADEVLLQLDRGVVLNFVVILVVGGILGGIAPTCKGS